MNALWTTRLCAYKQTPEALLSASAIIACKIRRQNVLLRRYDQGLIPALSDADSLGELLLEEARAARFFWSKFRKLLPAYAGFERRAPHGTDIVNRLLDIGYHHLTNKVAGFLDERMVPTDLGLLHVAKTAHAKPLAYDLVELFRSDIVDAEVLRFLRLKKLPVRTLTQQDVAHFLHEVNRRMERRYYLRTFRRCHAYRYYMELQMLRFIHAVNHGKIFEPLHLPTRNESRCLTKDR